MHLKYGFLLLVFYVVADAAVLDTVVQLLGGVIGGNGGNGGNGGTGDKGVAQDRDCDEYYYYIDDEVTTTKTTEDDCDYNYYIDEDTTTVKPTTTTVKPTTTKICRKYPDCHDRHCEEECDMLEKCPALIYQFLKIELECDESEKKEDCD